MNRNSIRITRTRNAANRHKKEIPLFLHEILIIVNFQKPVKNCLEKIYQLFINTSGSLSSLWIFCYYFLKVDHPLEKFYKNLRFLKLFKRADQFTKF